MFGLIWWTSRTATLAGWEKLALFFGVGVISGTIGIVYAHELLHQPTRAERWLGDLLLASVLYSHFRSEHLLVHHRHVGTAARSGDGALQRRLPPFLRPGAAAMSGVGVPGRSGDAGAQGPAVVASVEPVLALCGAARR